ncbi:MAG TPA: hypothetical protein EYG57_17490 [Planctomycetes bacterium]|nr:hypothetical protein [Planctomycetota bacterium]
MSKFCQFAMIIVIGLHSAGRLSSAEIDFVEKFALASDRARVLTELIPGTDEYYFYHCLQAQNTQRFNDVEKMLKSWRAQHGETPRAREIIYRQALLTYTDTPAKSTKFIKDRLNLRFDHQPKNVDRAASLPAVLDPKSVSGSVYFQAAINGKKNVSGFENSSLGSLVRYGKLTVEQRQSLLKRLRRPDYDGLVELIAADLPRRAFGSHPIHSLLLREQLDELLKATPALLKNDKFIAAYLANLQAGPESDWTHDVPARIAHFENIWQFVDRLAPAQNSLKAHMLFHLLSAKLRAGTFDERQFTEYLQLPRQSPIIARKYLEVFRNRKTPIATLTADYRAMSLMPPIGTDEPLIRAHLSHFFINANDYSAFSEYLDDSYLKRVFAETKILHGLGDIERWSSLLSPAQFKQLRERVDIKFAETSRQQFTAAEPVSLDVDIKNVKSLIVKIYEINALNYYLAEGREIGTDLELDGLAANVQHRFEYNEPSFRRVTRHFEFPELERAGVYVVDFIGNGKSSRALIRKGELIATSRPTAAGQAITVFGDDRQPVEEAMVYVEGRRFTANKFGEILIPYSTNPATKNVVLSHEGLTNLHKLVHRGESYDLTGGFYIDRESLIRREKSRVLIRPKLTVNGATVSVAALSDIQLTVTSTNLQGVSATQTVRDFVLRDDGDAVHEFHTPPHAHQITVTLTAKVRRIAHGDEQSLATSASFSLNGMRSTKRILSSNLTRSDGLYAVDILGLSGEPQAGLPIQMSLKHRDYVNPIRTILKTAKNGRVVLGGLPGIASINVQLPDGTQRKWQLEDAIYRYPSTLHRRTEEMITLPYLGYAAAPVRREFSLLEIRGGRPVADHFAKLKLDGGRLEIRDLLAGDYQLLLPRENAKITIRITDGEAHHSVLVGKQRVLDDRQVSPMYIASMNVTDEAIRVQLDNVTDATRLHVFATRFVPEYSPFHRLGRIPVVEPGWMRPSPNLTRYVEERNIGDELQYIIDRQHTEKFPGNLLNPPSMLINPWAVRSTQTGTQNAESGVRFDRKTAGADGELMESEESLGRGGKSSDAGVYLEYLPKTSTSLLEVPINEDGIATITRESLGGLHMVHLIAIDDSWTDFRSLSFEETLWSPIDVRLRATFPLDQHLAQQQRVKALPEGTVLSLDEHSTTRMITYSQLSKVHTLYKTMLPNTAIAEFDFLARWHKLSDEQRTESYSKYACHELHLFLSRRDPEFFKTDVLPLIHDKKEKQFMDHYLLGHELSEYLVPWRYQQLNVLERVLLAERHADHLATTQKHLADLVRQNPIGRDVTTKSRETMLSIDAFGSLGMFKKSSNRPQVVELELEQNANRTLMLGGRVLNGVDRITAGRLATPETAAAKQPASRRRDRASQLMFERSAPDLYYLKQAEHGKALLFRQTDKTMEWAESQYYRIESVLQNRSLVGANRFWRDLVNRDPKEPFLSPNFFDAAGSLTEAITALALLDLPLDGEDVTLKYEDGNVIIKHSSAAIVAYEESASSEVRNDVPILTSQRFYDDSREYQDRNAQHNHIYVTDEFIAGTAYGCQIVVTNPTATKRILDVLIQIPARAVPLADSRTTRTIALEVPPFQTKIVQYSFYFPLKGDFPHYPVQIALDEKIVAFADAKQFKVLDEPTKFDTKSWPYVSQRGTDADIVEFLQDQPLEKVNLDDVAYRLRDKVFFNKMVEILDSRRVYHRTTWSYAVMHDDADRINTFLQNESGFLKHCGPILDSPILTVDPLVRGTYQHYEFRPLINARAHQLGKTRKILNDQLSNRYHQLLSLLAHQREIDAVDRLAIVYYLSTQSRTGEALAHFALVNPEKLETKIQYDYMSAYLDFFAEEPLRAEEISARYADYPVKHWRDAFAGISSQLAELGGGAASVVVENAREQEQTVRADAEPMLDVKQDGKKILLVSKNVAEAEVNFYAMDIEGLFSRNPFMQQDSKKFSYVRPNHRSTVQVAEQGPTEIEIPAELSQTNVLVEVRGGGKTSSVTVLANSLQIGLSNNYGQLQVRHSLNRKTLNTVYVKVYSRNKDGTIHFYKDGYTDLRGRFDYASLSTNQLDQVQRFAVLVMSEEHGALIKELDPPAR